MNICQMHVYLMLSLADAGETVLGLKGVAHKILSLFNGVLIECAVRPCTGSIQFGANAYANELSSIVYGMESMLLSS